MTGRYKMWRAFSSSVTLLGFALAASFGQVCPSPSLSGQSQPTHFGPPPHICPAILAGYASCQPALGSAATNGEDADLGYDISAATGNLFLAQPDIHVHPALGPDLNFIRYYNSQGNGADIGLGPNWTHSFSWSITINPGKNALIVTDTGREILFTANGSGWTPQNGEFGSLAAASGSVPVYTNKFGTAYTFDPSGRLIYIQPADNYAIRINYSSGIQISSVTSEGPCATPALCAEITGPSLQFSYFGSHISSVSDPAGAVWLYGYTPPLIPGLCVSTRIPRSTRPTQLLQTGTGLLQTVTIPNANLPAYAVHGMILYSYNQQAIGGATFSPGTGPAQLTGYAAITGANPVQYSGGLPQPQSNVTEAVLGLFSYINAPASGEPMVAEVASGVVAGQLLRDIQISYTAPIPDVQLVTTVKLNGGSKTITSTYIDPFDARLASVASTAGTGSPGEMQSESWKWNGNLTLAEHWDGNNIQTVFGSHYDALGNPTSITEAFGTPQARTTRIAWHPVLSRPLTVLKESVTTPGCFNSSNPCQTHQTVFDYDPPVGGQYSNAWNVAPSNYLYQIVEIGYTAADLSGDMMQMIHTAQIKRDTNHRVVSVSGPAAGQFTAYDYSPSTGYLLYKTQVVQEIVCTPITTESLCGVPTKTLTTTFSTYDNDGRLTAVVDPNGSVTETAYDFAGMEISSTIYSAGGTYSGGKTYLRDLAENVVRANNADGTIISTELDTALRPWRVSATPAAGTPLAGSSTVWSRVIDYDSFGRPLTVRLFTGLGSDAGSGCAASGTEDLCKDFVYDPWERRTIIHTLDQYNNPCPNNTTGGENCTTSYTYDGNGNVTSVGNSTDRATIYTLDPLNRVVTIQNKDGGLATLGYDVNDHIVSRRDPLDSQNNGGQGGSRLTTYFYDDFGCVVEVSNPNIGSWASNYDSAGNLVASQDATGAIIVYQYDLVNRRTAVLNAAGLSPNENVSFTYDETGLIPNYPSATFSNTQGRLSSVTTSDRVSNFAYGYRGDVLLDVETSYNDLIQDTNSTKIMQYGRQAGSSRLDSVTYPDGLVATFQYPSVGGLATTLQPSGVSVPFNGTPTELVSNLSYFADGRISEMTFGISPAPVIDTWSAIRNKRGETTSIVSGWTLGVPSYWELFPPIMTQSYTYDSTDVGQLTAIDFFPGASNSWHWSLGYDNMGRLNSYWTNVRPVTDTYTWSYDKVGKRTADYYNGTTRTFMYDPAGITDQLQGVSGFSYITPWVSGIFTARYDSNGSLAAVVVEQNYTFSTGQSYNPYFQFQYNSHHHLKEFDQLSPSNSSYPNGQPSSFVSTPFQQDFYDGLDRIAEVYCPVSPDFEQGGYALPMPAFGVCGNAVWKAWMVAQASGGNENLVTTWHQFFYGSDGRLLEEFENNGASANGCAAYDVTDHLYLADLEIARVVRQYVSSGGATNCAPNSYNYVDKDIFYLHHDARGVLFAVESQAEGGLAWEAEIAPPGQVMNVGLPGADGKIGTADDIVFPDPRVITLTSGIAAASVDGQIGAFSDSLGDIDPAAGTTTVPEGNVWSPYGTSAYLPTPTASGPGGIGSGDAGFGASPWGLLASLVLSAEPTPGGAKDAGAGVYGDEVTENPWTAAKAGVPYREAPQNRFFRPLVRFGMKAGMKYGLRRAAKAAFVDTEFGAWFESGYLRLAWQLNAARVAGEEALGLFAGTLGAGLINLLTLSTDSGQVIEQPTSINPSSLPSSLTITPLSGVADAGPDLSSGIEDEDAGASFLPTFEPSASLVSQSYDPETETWTVDWGQLDTTPAYVPPASICIGDLEGDVCE
jgi:YD repeat-containing protein